MPVETTEYPKTVGTRSGTEYNILFPTRLGGGVGGIN